MLSQLPLVFVFSTFVAAGAVTAAAQSASIAGTVVADGDERPLASAEIVIADLKRSTVSDSAGHFSFDAIPRGKHRVSMRIMGFTPYAADITSREATHVEADFLLTKFVPVLAAVDVTAKLTVGGWRLQQFNDRRHGRTGYFLDASAFDKTEGRSLSSILLSHIAVSVVFASPESACWRVHAVAAAVSCKWCGMG